MAFFSTKAYDRTSFDAIPFEHDITYYEPRLTAGTVSLAQGFDAVCVFVNDVVDREVLTELAEHGVKIIALRCAGFNNVDVPVADELGLTVVRVPAYSPHAVAEHTIAIMLSLNRRLHKSYNRVREGDFRLDGLLGFDVYGRTAGVVGTGKIGECVCQILKGFGCRVLAFDPQPNSECEAMGVEYVSLTELLSQSDIVSLHCPLTPDTHHLINDATIAQMKQNVMIINTSRGAIIDTRAVIRGLKSGRIGWLGIDVYEEEADLFFEDLSARVIRDDVFSRLQTFPNVMITGHQAFFTADALRQIATTTLKNLTEAEAGVVPANKVASKR